MLRGGAFKPRTSPYAFQGLGEKRLQLLAKARTETGLAMMPGGIATAVMALVCGRLLTGERPLVDPRVLILSGMGLMLLSMWTLGHLSTAAGEADARYALIIRG